jgi:vesicle coat complex subunit
MVLAYWSDLSNPHTNHHHTLNHNLPCLIHSSQLQKKVSKMTITLLFIRKIGEISEWKQMLNSDKEAVRKEGVKKVIAAMTVGKDVSMLFSEVTKSIITNNIELKKLVYLYIMNYAKTQPELAIMSVNAFVNVCIFDNKNIYILGFST